MTTIAYDGKNIACDGLVVSNWIETTNFKKIFENIGDYKLVAISGELYQVISFIKWLGATPLNYSDQPHGDYIVLCIDYKNNIYDADMCVGRGFEHLFRITSKFTAIGTGSKFALGAMLAGVTAEQAVKIACKLDVNSGGKIRNYKVK